MLGRAGGVANLVRDGRVEGYHGSRSSSALMERQREDSKIGVQWGRGRGEVGAVGKATRGHNQGRGEPADGDRGSLINGAASSAMAGR
jgi:hypothetical protein